MPNVRVRGCARIAAEHVQPVRRRRPEARETSRTVDGRSTCEVGASETVIGPVRFGRFDQHHGFRRRGNRRQPHGGRAGNERQAFTPAVESREVADRCHDRTRR